MYDYSFEEYVVNIAERSSVLENIANAIMRVTGLFGCMLESSIHIQLLTQYPLKDLQISESLHPSPKIITLNMTLKNLQYSMLYIPKGQSDVS
jgi:hypothetical protein